MPFLIDEVVESALGPWGLALGVGVAAIAARRGRAAGGEAPKARGRHRLSPVAIAAGSGAAALKRTFDRARTADLRDRAQSLVAGATHTLNDLYEEARREVEEKVGRTSEFTAEAS